MTTGCGAREAVAYARELGARVQDVRRTGEIRLSHPLIGQRVTVNNRRKDASRALTSWIKRVRRAIEAAAREATA